MPKISLDIGLAIGGIVLTIILVVLDKAGKLKGPTLYWLLAFAALMTLPLVLGNSVVRDASDPWKYWARAFAISVVGLIYWAIGVWISPPEGKPIVPPATTRLQITYGMLQTLPIVVSPGAKLYILSFHNNETSSVSRATNLETKEWYWPQKDVASEFIGLCQLWNQGEKIIFNISTTFGVHFRQHGKNMPDISYTKQGVFIDGSLKPGDHVRIYLVNESTYDVMVDLPDGGELEVQGVSGRQKAAINRLTTSIVDQVPPFLVPSRNKWPQ